MSRPRGMGWRTGLAVLLLAVGAVGAALAEAAAPLLEGPGQPATAGYYRLAWHLPADDLALFELQEARDPLFAAPVTVYRGRDQATVLSGRTDGTYYYRLRAIAEDGAGAGRWSAPLAVSVAHHPLERALGFFAAGGVVFLATLVLIVGGARGDAKEIRA